MLAAGCRCSPCAVRQLQEKAQRRARRAVLTTECHRWRAAGRGRAAMPGGEGELEARGWAGTGQAPAGPPAKKGFSWGVVARARLGSVHAASASSTAATGKAEADGFASSGTAVGTGALRPSSQGSPARGEAAGSASLSCSGARGALCGSLSPCPATPLSGTSSSSRSSSSSSRRADQAMGPSDAEPCPSALAAKSWSFRTPRAAPTVSAPSPAAWGTAAGKGGANGCAS